MKKKTYIFIRISIQIRPVFFFRKNNVQERSRSISTVSTTSHASHFQPTRTQITSRRFHTRYHCPFAVAIPPLSFRSYNYPRLEIMLMLFRRCNFAAQKKTKNVRTSAELRCRYLRSENCLRGGPPDPITLWRYLRKITRYDQKSLEIIKNGLRAGPHFRRHYRTIIAPQVPPVEKWTPRRTSRPNPSSQIPPENHQI